MSVSVDRTIVTVTVESDAEGVPGLPADVNLVELFPWAAQTLFVERVPVRVADRDSMPSEAQVDRQSLTELNVRAALVVPVESDGVVTHLIVLNVLGRNRDWPEALTTRLRLLGEMVVAALGRQASFLALEEAQERLSLAVAAADAGLWTLDYAAGTFWASERARAIFGYRKASPSTWHTSSSPSIRRLASGQGRHRPVARTQETDRRGIPSPPCGRQPALDRLSRSADGHAQGRAIGLEGHLHRRHGPSPGRR